MSLEDQEWDDEAASLQKVHQEGLQRAITWALIGGGLGLFHVYVIVPLWRTAVHDAQQLGLLGLVVPVILCAAMAYFVRLFNDEAEELMLDGDFKGASTVLRRVVGVERLLGNSAERAPRLVMLATAYTKDGDTRNAAKCLREAIDMITYRRQSVQKVFGEDQNFLAEWLNRNLDQQFRCVEAIACLDFAQILVQKDRKRKAISLCQVSIDQLQEYRAQVVRKMSAEQVAKRRTERNDHWLLLCKTISDSERLALIDKVIADAYELRRKLLCA